jgi:hypothetical protein
MPAGNRLQQNVMIEIKVVTSMCCKAENKPSSSRIQLLVATHGFTVHDWRCDMKSLATAIALATVLASPVYAMTAHPRHTATFNNQARGHTAVIRNPRVFLLENRGAGTTNQVSDFQSNWDVSY